MDVGALAELLAERRFTECRAEAEQLIRRPDLAEDARTQACLALSYSLAALGDCQSAIGPGELALHYARRAGDYDAVGHALCHLAAMYHDNRLHKRALACLDEYLRQFTLFREARTLEGWVLAHLALFYRAMGQGQQALAYYQKAYRWHKENTAVPKQLDHHRAELTWQYLRLGRLEPAAELMALSAGYLKRAPNDLEARARYLNNQAYLAFLRSDHPGAFEAALEVVHMKGAPPARVAQACLTLLHSARTIGLRNEARALGNLARIHASVARRPDLEEEATRALLQVENCGGAPLADELFRALSRQIRNRA